MHTLSRWIVLLFSAASLAAQVNVAGAGYRIPSKLIRAAPNQIVIISLNNVPRRLQAPVNLLPGPTGYPLQADGFSMQVTDGRPAPREAGFIAIQQTEDANPITSFTVLMPIDLAVPSSPFFDFTGTLTLFDNGAAIATFPFRPVSDSVHFLNSCDETRIFVGVLSDVPNRSDCIPVVINKNLLVSSSNPIRPGDGVASYLYGLGAIVRKDDPFGRLEPIQPIDLNFDYRPNAPASRAVSDYGLTGKPFLAVGWPGGLYQVNFMVPPIPRGVTVPECNGTTIRSNLTVTISGPNSIDSASFCISQR